MGVNLCRLSKEYFGQFSTIFEPAKQFILHLTA